MDASSLSLPPAPENNGERRLTVTVTAYNSTRSQTDSTPRTTAFGDHLEPGVKAIAVSDDLYALGLREGTRVRFEGLPGEWVVEDKMGDRWHRKVDLYLGDNRQAAKEFGVKRLTMRWRP